jgi:probable F420-dependent oxidoreductase
VKFGLAVPMAGDPLPLAQLAEELGFDTVYVSDHLVPPPAQAAYGRNLEALTVLAAIAAVTSIVRVGTSVIVVPLREPLLFAKQVATIDLLSGGRLVLGVGAGWVEGEFQNVGSDFKTRGARTDETIRLLRHLFSGSSEPFWGRFTTLEDFVFAPIPPQGEKLPILVGGHSPAAIRRAAAVADRYQPTFVAPEEFARLRAAVIAEAGGRPIEFGCRIGIRAEQAMDEVVEAVKRYEAEGVEEITLGFAPGSASADRLRQIGELVLPEFSRPS